MTCGAIAARLRITFVDFVLAILAGESCLTRTIIAVDAIDACAAVHTRAIRTVLVVDLTIHAGKSQRTCARVRVHILIAGGAILARIRQTFVDIDLAILALEAVQAQACVVTGTVQTCTTILAW